MAALMWLVLLLVQVAGMVWAWRWLGTSDEENDRLDGKRLFWSFLWPLVWLASWIGRM